MSGYIEFFEEDVKCPQCKTTFKAPAITDDECRQDNNRVTHGLCGGKAKCPQCNATATDANIIVSDPIDQHLKTMLESASKLIDLLQNKEDGLFTWWGYLSERYKEIKIAAEAIGLHK